MWGALSLTANILIVGTGGAVRLTGSGLGCPTWPKCTEDSLVATSEMGLHGVIEFGNRLLTFVLVAIALVSFLSVARRRRERPELFRLTLTIGLGIIVQAGLGGVTVLLDLHPGAVGVHYTLSVALVCVAATLVYRLRHGSPTPLKMDRAPAYLMWLLVAVTALTVYLGTLVTGAGPHAGDEAAARNGLDPSLVQHFHSWPSYAMLALTIGLLVLAFRGTRHTPNRELLWWLLAIELLQMGVGIAQSRLGLPIGLVGVHMVLACVLAMVLTWVVHSSRTPAVGEHPRRSA